MEHGLSGTFDIFLELSLVVVVVLAVSLIMRLLKQPLIIGYILTGILVGPLILDIVHYSDPLVDVFAHFGIALLLFIIGLGLNPSVIKDVGKTAALTGIAQVIFTTAVGWLIVSALGYSPLTALYISLALAFSSTIIVLKLISDKREHHRLYAKISVGFLLIQDICAALLLVFAEAIKRDSFSLQGISELIFWGLALIAGLWLLGGFILPKIKSILSDNQELLFIFALAWGLGFGALFKGTGFSLEVGALAAGIALANQTYVSEIASRLKPLRDFFIVMFFVALGAGIQFTVLGQIIPQAILLSLFVLIGNPIIVMVILGFLGFTKKTSFKAGLIVAQISEFSLIFIALIAGSLGDQETQVVGLVTLIALITIAASSYMIIYSDKIYTLMSPFLNIFERKQAKSEESALPRAELFLIGYTKGGEQFIKAFKALKKPYLIIDYNPEIIDYLANNSLPHAYGDISDLELLEELRLTEAKMIVSIIYDFETNCSLLNHLSYQNDKKELIFICSADTPEQAKKLYTIGANYVLLPHHIGGAKLVNFIKNSELNPLAFDKLRETHLARLKDGESEIKPTQQKSRPEIKKRSGRFRPRFKRKMK